MIDGRATTVDWRKHGGDVVILPLGAFEQHGPHLPLLTDTLQVAAAARMLAEEIDAALLEPLPYGTSMEHAGFRGSMSLRPETLMAIVRDVADEMERQGFRILVLLNGHGGNHCLVPTARDINRRDRGIKLLLVDYFLHSDPQIATRPRSCGVEIHAGEHETSLMLALHPDLVGDVRPDMEAVQEEHPLRQSDLTTFGVGHFAASGVIGFPSYATREKGEAIVASLRERLPPFVRDRIARLRADPRYAGPAGR